MLHKKLFVLLIAIALIGLLGGCGVDKAKLEKVANAKVGDTLYINMMRTTCEAIVLQTDKSKQIIYVNRSSWIMPREHWKEIYTYKDLADMLE